MISMQDYINSIKNKTDINESVYKNQDSASNQLSVSTTITSNSNFDSFEKENNKANINKNKTSENKINKKKIFKIGAIITGIGLAILAFLKRKQISCALSTLFNKKQPPKPSLPPSDKITNPKTPPVGPPIKPISSPNASTLSKYTELCKEFEELKSLDVSNPTRKAAAQKLNALEKEMIEQNISFVPKAPESFTSDEEKWKFINKALWETQRNEASTIDALSVFEKHGAKIYQAEPFIDTLGELGACTSTFLDKNKNNQESLNKVFRKYIDVYSKFATTEIKKGYSPDSRHLYAMYDSYCYWVDKETTLQFINALKSLAVDKYEYKRLEYFFKTTSFKDTSSAVCWLTKKDLPDIQKALDGFATAVENLPDDVMKMT